MGYGYLFGSLINKIGARASGGFSSLQTNDFVSQQRHLLQARQQERTADFGFPRNLREIFGRSPFLSGEYKTGYEKFFERSRECIGEMQRYGQRRLEKT